MVPPNEKLCDRCKQWKGEGVNKESEAYDRAHKKDQKY